MPMKMMAPNTALYWVDDGIISDRTQPTAAEINAVINDSAPLPNAPKAVNLSPAVIAGYTLNPTDSDTEDSQSIIDTGVGQTRGAANYEGEIPFYWEADPTSNSNSEYLIAHDMFKVKGRFGYWIRRVGYKWDEALATGQEVDIFYFQSWTPRVVTEDSGGAIKFTVPFLPMGFVDTAVALG